MRPGSAAGRQRPPLAQRMRWSVASGAAAGRSSRLPGLYMIVDYRAKRMAVVKPADRAVLDVSTAGPGLPGAAAGDYSRRGSGQVAGLPCTDWQTDDAAGQETLLCLTADGVMLRASQAGHVLLEATSCPLRPAGSGGLRAARRLPSHRGTVRRRERAWARLRCGSGSIRAGPDRPTRCRRRPGRGMTGPAGSPG